jgi:hypothetical protein
VDGLENEWMGWFKWIPEKFERILPFRKKIKSLFGLWFFHVVCSVCNLNMFWWFKLSKEEAESSHRN